MKTMKVQALAAAAVLLSSIVTPAAHAAAELKMGGVIFAQTVMTLSEQSNNTTGTALTDTNNTKGRWAMDVHRVYLTGDVKFDDHWKAKAILEARTEGSATSNTANNNVMLKGAWLEYGNLLDTGLNIQFGQIPLAWDSFEAGLHNRRYVLQQFADRMGFVGAWDKGISFYGKLPKGFGDYNAQIANGAQPSGTTNPSATINTEGTTANTGRNKFGSIFLSIVPIPNNDMLKGLRLNFYAQQEKQGLVDGTGTLMPSRERNMLFGGVSYKHSMGHLMGTYYSGNTATGATLATNAHSRPKGYSFHGSFTALPWDMSVFGRFDRFDAGVNQAPATVVYQPRRTTVFGVEKKMTDGIRIAIADIMDYTKNKGGANGTGVTPTSAWTHTIGAYAEAKF